VKILRREGRHDIRELTVAVRLEGDFEAAHMAGDNSAVLPKLFVAAGLVVFAGGFSAPDPSSR
jgi:urate oxidase